MSNNKMLIDAAHPEETRVVVVRGSRLEDFDFESANKKLLKGNIYLAKVTRVEPSLQACFVDFGGNRHGFLAFSEIHPDYYQIPTADREALIEEERHAAEAYEREENERMNKRHSRRRSEEVSQDVSKDDHDAQTNEENQENSETQEPQNHEEDENQSSIESVSSEENQTVENLGGDDSVDDMPERPFRRSRRYKIQEVIKRRQILLIQVVKEERGNKGAALTTYLSLAGRYAVLMPNTARGGGISRKINSSADRVRLKEMVQDLEVPEGMGVILRTAGASRTKMEIKRDFDYLLRLWDNVREFTLESMAPALVYEEGSLVKRAIRDIYSKDIDEVVVSGEEAYKEAREFMRMLMPSHIKNIKLYREDKPIFSRYGVEQQLDSMFSTIVKLRSGGYIVMNQTEALVAIDVNSGRSTREHNIEDTALKTNLEAADEIARQLRLRDLAGLVVIDFIDMLDRRNNRAVERRLKDCLRIDRARIQIGSISPFGLLEMSRQRLRAGVLEGSMVPCEHCDGAGKVRSVPSAAVSMLRALEEWCIHNTHHHPFVQTRSDIALFLLNNKRGNLAEIEQHFGVHISIEVAHDLNAHTFFAIHRGEPILNPVERKELRAVEPTMDEEEFIEEETQDEGISENQRSENSSGERSQDDDYKRRRRRRRRGRGGRDREGYENTTEGFKNAPRHNNRHHENHANDDGGQNGEQELAPTQEQPQEAPERTQRFEKPHRASQPKVEDVVDTQDVEATQDRRARWRDRLSRVITGKAFGAADESSTSPKAQEAAEPVAQEKPAKKPRTTKAKTKDVAVEAPVVEAVAETVEKPKAKKAAAPKKAAAKTTAKVEKEVVVKTETDPNAPKKSGWWSKKSAAQ